HIALTTCLAPNWWLPEQYDTPFIRISREDLCRAGHVYEPYPVCINAIDMGEVVRAAVPFFGR
ncbi:MAG TPA: hypothetical protein VF803_03035, partial [Candidatus Paceibacterota bacterium]